MRSPRHSLAEFRAVLLLTSEDTGLVSILFSSILNILKFCQLLSVLSNALMKGFPKVNFPTRNTITKFALTLEKIHPY